MNDKRKQWEKAVKEYEIAYKVFKKAEAKLVSLETGVLFRDTKKESKVSKRNGNIRYH